jgi:DNA-binding LacI/PurR family transcriptional regulator
MAKPVRRLRITSSSWATGGLGTSEIASVTSPIRSALQDIGSRWSAQGLPFAPELVVHGDGKCEGAAAGVEALLSLPRPPTAVVCYNDMTAFGAIRQLHLNQMRVPEDVSVVGFDDLFIASYMQPPLTTLQQPRRLMGRLAMESLLRLISGEATESPIKVPAKLIIRESTAPPREKEACVLACSQGQITIGWGGKETPHG